MMVTQIVAMDVMVLVLLKQDGHEMETVQQSDKNEEIVS